MLQLIKNIDKAWKNKETLLDINPKNCIGYFDFRNNVVLMYNKKIKEIA